MIVIENPSAKRKYCGKDLNWVVENTGLINNLNMRSYLLFSIIGFV